MPHEKQPPHPDLEARPNATVDTECRECHGTKLIDAPADFGSRVVQSLPCPYCKPVPERTEATLASEMRFWARNPKVQHDVRVLLGTAADALEAQAREIVRLESELAASEDSRAAAWRLLELERKNAFERDHGPGKCDCHTPSGGIGK